LSFATWALIYGLTGFIALALEIAWFRILGVMLKSTAFTFGTLLAIYLTGLGGGAAIGSRHVSRSARPGATFLLLQCAVALFVAASMSALMLLVRRGVPASLAGHLDAYEPIDLTDAIARTGGLSWDNPAGAMPLVGYVLLNVGLPALLVGPPTLLMGMSFPYLQRVSQSDFAAIGRRLGTLLAANIAGSVAGAAAAGWLLLPLVGTAGTLKLLVGLSAVLAIAFWRIGGSGQPAARARAAALLGLIGAGVAAMPNTIDLWARLHGTTPNRVIVREDGAGVALLKSEAPGMRGSIVVYVNGLGQSWIPYGNIHTALGALPLLVHPRPSEALLIGLGSGDTAFAALSRPDLARLVVVEIIGAQIDTLRDLATRRPYQGVVALLSDPRVEHRTGDGRAFLRDRDRTFDIIEADALRPRSAYAGNLYSREYFELLRRRLKPGGLAVTWVPTERVRRTFVSVFPHTLVFGDIALGSNAVVPFDRARLRERVAAVQDYYAAAGIDIAQLLLPYIDGLPRVYGPDHREPAADLNTDMFPRDEFTLPF
jgi:spermidine synthase